MCRAQFSADAPQRKSSPKSRFRNIWLWPPRSWKPKGQRRLAAVETHPLVLLQAPLPLARASKSTVSCTTALANLEEKRDPRARGSIEASEPRCSSL